MLESTPGAPYTGTIPDLLSVENNMRYRLVSAQRYIYDMANYASGETLPASI